MVRKLARKVTKGEWYENSQGKSAHHLELGRLGGDSGLNGLAQARNDLIIDRIALGVHLLVRSVLDGVSDCVDDQTRPWSAGGIRT